MGIRKPQREDSHLGPVHASLVLRDKWQDQELEGKRYSHGKRAALMVRGVLLVKGCRRPGWPQSPIWPLQHLSPTRGKSRVEPGMCRGCRRRWKISSLGGRVVTSVSLGCQEREQRSASPWAGTWNVFSHQEKGQFYAPGITFKLHEFSSHFLVKETLCRIRILSFLTQTKI